MVPDPTSTGQCVTTTSTFEVTTTLRCQPPAVNRRMEFNKLGIAITIMIEVRSDVVIKYFISIRFFRNAT